MKKMSFLFMTLALLSLGWVSFSQQSAHDLFQKALTKERAEGDLKGAIALYQEVVDSAQEESLAAQAQLRIGLCYEKLGNTEAVKAYEVVLSRFPKEAEAVAEAKGRLAALRKEEPAGLTMAKLLPPEVYMMCPALSPDGTKVAGIVFDRSEAEGENVAVYDLATGNMKLITDYTYSPESRWSYIPVWSPDSRSIAFKAGLNKDSAQELWITGLDGESRLLLENPNGGLVPCDWLPDGSAVLTILENENDTAGLGLVSLKDGSFKELCPLLRTYDQEYAPKFAANGAFADASPDGRLIAFSDGPPDGGMDIFVISIDNRSKVALIDYPGDDRQPRWSPDGKHIVFLSNRHGNRALWGISVRDGKPDGPPFMIMEGMQDSDLGFWTKNGLLTRTELSINEIYIQEIDPQSHVALGKPRIVDHSPSEGYVGPNWSPDGRFLEFKTYSRLTGKAEAQIIIPAEGGKARKFNIFPRPITPLQGGFGEWLPDSSGIGVVYWDIEKHLYFSSLALDTGEWKTRSIPAGEEFSGFFRIVWSRDGKAFFAFKKGEDGAEPGLVEHDLETGQERYLFRAQPGEGYGNSLRDSRDHKRLALDKNGLIMLVDTDTGHVEMLEFSEKKHLYSPSWSPDGKFLVAKGVPDGGRDFTELFIVSIPDGKFKSLDIRRYLPHAQSRILTSPDWSPDGRKIAFDVWASKSEASLLQNLIPKK